ncbi:MAG: EamA family transporter, partial [Terriglobales bacterium]
VIAGTLLAGTGAPPAATAPAGRRSRPALVAAALGAVTFGTVFYFLAAGAARSSPAAPVLMFRLAGAALLALPLLWGQRLPRGLYRSGWLWATGLLDSFAYLLYAEAARHTAVSVVSALSGLFTIWTLLLAIVFLRERLRWWQWCGVVLIVAAIAALALQ